MENPGQFLLEIVHSVINRYNIIESSRSIVTLSIALNELVLPSLPARTVDNTPATRAAAPQSRFGSQGERKIPQDAVTSTMTRADGYTQAREQSQIGSRLKPGSRLDRMGRLRSE